MIGEGTTIGPYCIIGPNVVIGANCNLIAHVHVTAQTTIGAGCTIYPVRLARYPAAIAELTRGELTRLEIGAGCTIRESVDHERRHGCRRRRDAGRRARLLHELQPCRA